MGFQEILQEHDGRQGQKVPDGAEDFAAFDIGHAGGKARRLAHDRPCAGTFKTAAGGRNIYPFRHRRRFPRVPEFASDEEPGPGLAPRESFWSVSRKFSRIRFQLGRHKRTGKRASEGRNAEERKSPGGGICSSESGIERKLAAALRPHGGCVRKIRRTWRQGRNEKRRSRRQ